MRLGSRISAAGSGKLVLSEWMSQSRLPSRLAGGCCTALADDGDDVVSVTVESSPVLPADGSAAASVGDPLWYPIRPYGEAAATSRSLGFSCLFALGVSGKKKKKKTEKHKIGRVSASHY